MSNIIRPETPPESPLIHKAAIRDRLEQDMARFFAEGNTIQQLGNGEIAERDGPAFNKSERAGEQWPPES